MKTKSLHIRRRGATLVEIIVGMVIISICVVGVSLALNSALNSSSRNFKTGLQLQIADNVLAWLENLPIYTLKQKNHNTPLTLNTNTISFGDILNQHYPQYSIKYQIKDNIDYIGEKHIEADIDDKIYELTVWVQENNQEPILLRTYVSDVTGKVMSP